jgi:EmrB/QacA subfamily drug resistance transporter
LSRASILEQPRTVHQRLTLALLAFAHLIISLDYTIVFVALPDIGRELHFSAQTVQWVISAYVVPYGGLLLLGGRACDLLGRRRMFAVGMFLFAAASLAGGLAATAEQLVIARAIQGIGGAFLFPATLSLINTLFAEGRERNLALSVWAGVGASGMAFGGLLGGMLTQVFGWKSIFLVNVPLAGLALAAIYVLIDRDRAVSRGRRFDLPGAAIGTLGTILLVFALVQGPESGWGSQLVVGTGISSVVLLALFFGIEALSRDPLMPLQLFANRNLRTGLLIIGLFTATFGSLLYFLSLYFQIVLRYSALTAGLAYLVPYSIIFVTSSSAGRLATKYGMRTMLTTSLALGACGMLMLGVGISSQGTFFSMLPGLVTYSAGMGLTFPVMFAAATSGVAGHQQGIASGIASTAQQLGSAIGLAVLVSVANAGADGLSGEPLRVANAVGVQNVTYISAVIALVMMLVARRLDRATVNPLDVSVSDAP